MCIEDDVIFFLRSQNPTKKSKAFNDINQFNRAFFYNNRFLYAYIIISHFKHFVQENIDKQPVFQLYIILNNLQIRFKMKQKSTSDNDVFNTQTRISFSLNIFATH